MALSEAEQKLKDLKMKQAGRRPEDEPPPKGDDEKETQGDDNEVDLTDPKQLKKLVKANKALESRVNQLIAEKKERERKKDEPDPETEYEKEKNELLQEYQRVQSQRDKLYDQYEESVANGETDKARALRKKLDDNMVLISKLERMNEEAESKKDKAKLSKKDKEIYAKWNEGYFKAAKFIDRRSDEGQDIFLEDGSLNKKSEVLNLALKLMEEDAEPARKMKVLGVDINPEFDHPNGVYDAIKEAYDILSRKGKAGKKKKSSLRDQLGIEDDDEESDDEKEQMLDTDRSGSDGTSSKSKLAKMKEVAMKAGVNSPEWTKYYKEVRKKYDKPLYKR